MSIREAAKRELELINFGEDDSKVMLEILDKFFDQWDSGGAVWAVAPVLQRLIAGKCLSPLTGEDDEWVFHYDDGMAQNRRCSTVFKKIGTSEAWDIDNPKGPREPITFPYWPERAEVMSPVVKI